jgi:F-type H+-transporting ATPase subunit alpha
MLKQPQYSPMPMEEQAVSIYSCTPQEERPSWVRNCELQDIQRYEKELLDYVRTSHGDILSAVRDSGKLEEEVEQKLIAALDAFADIFQPTKAAAASEAA